MVHWSLMTYHDKVDGLNDAKTSTIIILHLTYNYSPIRIPDDSLKVDNDEGLPILNSVVELSITILNSGKTPGINNIPGELIKSGVPIMTSIFRGLSQQIWVTKVWLKS